MTRTNILFFLSSSSSSFCLMLWIIWLFCNYNYLLHILLLLIHLPFYLIILCHLCVCLKAKWIEITVFIEITTKRKQKKNQLKWVFAILHFIYLLSQSDSNKTKFKWIDVQLHWNVDFSLMYKYITSNHINWTWNAGRSIFIHIDTIIMNMNDLQIYIFARNVAIVISDYVVVFEPVR